MQHANIKWRPPGWVTNVRARVISTRILLRIGNERDTKEDDDASRRRCRGMRTPAAAKVAKHSFAHRHKQNGVGQKSARKYTKGQTNTRFDPCPVLCESKIDPDGEAMRYSAQHNQPGSYGRLPADVRSDEDFAEVLSAQSLQKQPFHQCRLTFRGVRARRHIEVQVCWELIPLCTRGDSTIQAPRTLR